MAKGLALALVSALTFGTAGALGRGMLEAGWTPAAVVLARIWIAALVLVPFALAGRQDWAAVRRSAGLIVAYGVVAVAGTQLFYFNAIARIDVGLALLIEYTAPVGVIGWLWLRHGVRPGARTALGAVCCLGGLLLMLQIASGARADVAGVAWAVAAMGCATAYFLLSARTDTGVPPLVLGAFGLLAGALALTLAGAVGLVQMRGSRTEVSYAIGSVPYWLPLIALGVVSAAIAYLTGIAASRLLGSRMASFLALLEVVAAVGFAWLLVGQRPGGVQILGGLLVLAGVVVVKSAEPRRSAGDRKAGDRSAGDG